MATHSLPVKTGMITNTPTDIIVPSDVVRGPETDSIAEQQQQEHSEQQEQPVPITKKTTPTEILIPVDIDQGPENSSIDKLQRQQCQQEHLHSNTSAAAPAHVTYPLGADHRPKGISAEKRQLELQKEESPLKFRMVTPTQVIITAEVEQPSKTAGKDLLRYSQEQLKEKSSSALTPSASEAIDPTALANITIPDKVKKYPGFIHPYAIYIQECQTFRVESLVSAGGFGSVFKVVNGAKTFAIKAQRAKVSVQRDRMFRSEARFLKRSVHANVVGFFGEFRHGDHLCLRLEWMPKTVFDIIARRASIQEVQQITYSIASGLKSLHEKNFVHRDIKPENVLVSGPASRMIVKLADFGLAGYMKGGRKLRGSCGTPVYRAPEMLEENGQKEYGTAVDMYSFGVILRQLMYNILPTDDTIAIHQGKTLIDNLTDKEEHRLSAEGVLDHPFLSSHRSKDVKQQRQIQQYQAELQENDIKDSTAKHILEQEHPDPRAKVAKKPRLVLIANDTVKPKSMRTSENIVKVSTPHSHPLPPSSK